MEKPTPIPRAEGVKPCPFCGFANLYWDSMIIDQEEQHFLCCTECGAEGPISPVRQVAGLLWEVRHI